MLTPKRNYEEELLDAGEGNDDDVAGNLIDLRRLNRYLGGVRPLARAVASKLGNGIKHISLLDVGTGSADIPAAIANRCRLNGAEPFVAALDISERNLRLSRLRLGVSRDVALLRADALSLPFAAASFDFVTASQFLHHFHEEQIVRLLAELARVAAKAVFVCDLERSFVPYYFTRAATSLFATSRLTANDGPVSVLKGFTADELRSLAVQAGLGSFKVRRVLAYRLLLEADVTGRRATAG
jgi:2-polyprenyl-3-methyl-5-hydroxy-6-metoxy-1,4-benzoquinol methylase